MFTDHGRIDLYNECPWAIGVTFGLDDTVESRIISANGKNSIDLQYGKTYTILVTDGMSSGRSWVIEDTPEWSTYSYTFSWYDYTYHIK